MRVKNLVPLATMAMILALPSAASAFPGAQKALSMMRHHSSKSLATAANCTDFSGSWQGRCIDDDDGTQFTDEVFIDQYGCESVWIPAGLSNGREFDFGGAFNETSVSLNNTESSTLYLDWSSDKSAIVWRSVGQRKDRKATQYWDIRASGSYRISDKILLVKDGYLQTLVGGDKQESDATHLTCSYEKKSN